MTEEAFTVKDGELDRWLASVAQLAGFDVSEGVDGSGFVPTLRHILDGSDYKEYSSHPRDMATQVAWVSYLFIAQRDGLERPNGFVPKSILVEAVDGPYMYDSVRVSLWSTEAKAPFMVASGAPIEIARFKHPQGIPASYAPARWVIDNLFEIVADQASNLIPFARAIADESRARAGL